MSRHSRLYKLRTPVGPDGGHLFAEEIARATSINGEFILAGAEVYSQLSGGRLPPLPATRDKLDPNENKDVFSVRRTTWFTPHRPYLPLLPRFDILTRTHPAFRSLCHKYGHFPLIKDSAGRYKLDPGLTQDWDILERWLRKMVLRLWDVSGVGSPFVTRSFSLWPYPASHGYIGFVGTKGMAQRVAASARNAFYPLIAACSFFILCCERRSTRDPSFEWKTCLSDQSDATPTRNPHGAGEVHAAWIHELVNSFAGDWEVERIGAVFEARDPNTVPFLQFFGGLKMPIIINWGTVPSIVKSPYGPLSRYFPNTEAHKLFARGPRKDVISILELAESALHCPEPASPETDTCPALARCPRNDVSASSQHSSSSSLTNDVPHIPIDKRSGQKPGEDVHAFLARRKADDEKKVLTDDAIERQRIADRETAAAKFSCPGEKGSIKVWCWFKEYFGDGPQDFFRVRTRVETKEIRDEWFGHNNSMKVFNGRENCWDICSDLGEGPPLDEYDLDSGTEPDMDGATDLSSIDAVSVDQDVVMTDSTAAKRAWETAAASVGNDSFQPSTESELEEGELEEEDGLKRQPHSSTLAHPEKGPSTCHASADVRDALLLSADEVSKHLFMRSVDSESVEILFPFSIVDIAYSRFGFTDYTFDTQETLKNKKISELEPECLRKYTMEALGNGRWLDTCPRLLEERPPAGTMDRLCLLFSRLLVEETRLCPAFDLFFPDSQLCLPGYRRFRVIPRRIGRDEEVMYQLIGGEGFDLLIPDPVGVLQTFRLSWGPTLIDVARQLVRNGIRFYSLVPGPPASAEASTHLRGEPRLGFRDRRYLPDLNDYHAYISARNYFLQTSRGRAALFEGGHVARIAREVVDEGSVVYGPDLSTVFLEGRCFFEDSGIGYWGEFLTDEESDLICGIYYCPTNNTEDWGNPAYLNTHRSWYPRLGAFRSSSLNVGYWSRDCERWYQHRRNECVHGDTEVKDASNWKRGMKLNRSVTKISKANATIAHEFLQKHYPF
ncbi:hypothetical protein V5O48_001827 [Marasmius crinis-equi]|uniref:Uncharacterized protein n=1 Tax=Marasmius crinis-equi TaxID=585013 RepID=A0ABR3FXN6_9AGAR